MTVTYPEGGTELGIDEGFGSERGTGPGSVECASQPATQESRHQRPTIVQGVELDSCTGVSVGMIRVFTFASRARRPLTKAGESSVE
jgi:hypothetical protein